MKLGSLFDGSGGFPLAGLINGIEPVWASEIEPFPIRVTTKRIPQMKHYGDISKLNGAELPPVDIITFGSPCQDLSVAGQRAGLHDGKHSNLFFEAIRIIKEMREATNGKYPRYIVWENVPGAFSSNKGEDFRCVLESICRIKDETLSVPKANKWRNAGSIVGEHFSLAWRVLDAQYWGVPQRRRRIFLVADFAGECAGEILFEPEGVSRNFTPSGIPWQRTAGNVEAGTGASGFDGYNGQLTGDVSSTLGINCGMSTGRNGVVLNDQGESVMSVTEDMTATLRAEEHGHQPCVLHSAKSRSVGYEEERSPTLRAGVVPGKVMSFEPGAASRVGGHTDENISGSLRASMGDNQTAIAIENYPTDGRCRIEQDGKVQTLTSRMGTGGNNVPLVMNAPKTLKIRSGCEGGGKGALIQEDRSATLSCNNDQTVFVPTAFGICSDKSNSMQSSNPRSGIYKADTSRTIDVNGGNPACNQGGIAVVCVDQGGGKSACNITENMSPTLTCTHGGEPAVCLQGSMIGRQDKNGPQGSGVNEAEPCYIVRRLTPTECARLQGFPDWWCDDLGTENPTEDEISFWSDVWETYRKIMGKSSKPKTRKQIIKWLNNPHSDSAEYKMWGNGIALPCVCFVLAGIVLSAERCSK